MRGGTLKPAQVMRILGVDTSLRSTGVGIVEKSGSRLVPVYHGTIKNAATLPLSGCLINLQQQIGELLLKYQPDAVAIEGIFYAKNVKTMLLLSHARGAIIAQCAKQDYPVFEYEPRKVKMAVVGRGSADKSQVQQMVKTLLHLEQVPQSDAADALALAITHLHRYGGFSCMATETPI
jgi:crossover junction endodeoxyribonuclease RuvC